jgi:hypothetical protein
MNKIHIGNITYYDIRNRLQDFDIAAGMAVYDEVLDKQLDVALEATGFEVGCETPIRHPVIYNRWREYRAGGGTDTFETFRDAAEAARPCLDLVNNDTFLMLGFRGPQKIPIGGFGLFNIEELGPVSQVDPTIEFRAFAAPMTRRPEDSADLMRRFLDSPVAGRNRQNVPKDFQLIRWVFPRLDRRNLWDITVPSVSGYLSNVGTHTLNLNNQDGVDFPISIVRVP